MKQLDKDLSKVFFNSVEEMNECYGIDAELPSNLHSKTDLVCYEIVEPFVYECFGERYNISNIDIEILLNKSDFDNYEGRCFVYVRVNNRLREHLEKSLLGCEFVFHRNKTEKPYRRFVHSVEVTKSGVVFVKDQYWLSGYLSEQLFYTDDNSDPIPYKEWVKQINKQDMEMED